MILPSLPGFPSVSLPEVVWVVTSLYGFWVAVATWWKDKNPRIRLKNSIRASACLTFLGAGLVAMFNPPAANPTWLSVLSPMTFAFGAFSMALLSVIDEQTTG